MYDSPVTAEDKRWRAESDADTLAEAQQIADNPDRMAAAKAAADRMANERAERAQNMRKVAGKKAGAKPYTEKGAAKEPGRGPTGTGSGSPKGMADVPLNFLK